MSDEWAHLVVIRQETGRSDYWDTAELLAEIGLDKEPTGTPRADEDRP